MITFASAKPIIELVVAMSVGAIIEDTAKLLTPTSMKTLGKFSIRIGSSVVGAMIGGVVANYLVEQLQAINDIEITDDVDSDKEDDQDNN